jgi:hypothetical protein
MHDDTWRWLASEEEPELRDASEAARLLADAVSEAAAPMLREPEDVEPPQ